MARQFATRIDSQKQKIGDRKPRTIPTKDLPHQVVFLGGGGWCVRIVGTQETGKIRTTPRFCTRDVDCRFCGGGAWISRSEKNYVHNVRAIRTNRKLRFTILAPRSAIRKKRVQFGNPETIRTNRAI